MRGHNERTDEKWNNIMNKWYHKMRKRKVSDALILNNIKISMILKEQPAFVNENSQKPTRVKICGEGLPILNFVLVLKNKNLK